MSCFHERRRLQRTMPLASVLQRLSTSNLMRLRAAGIVEVQHLQAASFSTLRRLFAYEPDFKALAFAAREAGLHLPQLHEQH